MAKQGAFDRDFGYLMPFLDKVAAAANDVADAQARAELIALLEGERARWARVRELLAGAPAGPSEREDNRHPQGEPASSLRGAEFTVGTLRGS